MTNEFTCSVLLHQHVYITHLLSHPSITCRSVAVLPPLTRATEAAVLTDKHYVTSCWNCRWSLSSEPSIRKLDVSVRNLRENKYKSLHVCFVSFCINQHLLHNQWWSSPFLVSMPLFSQYIEHKTLCLLSSNDTNVVNYIPSFKQITK